jgi:ABC-2 type transport system permease protein
MSFSWTRVEAIFRKELRDYRRNRFVIFTMSALPLLFIVLTMIQLFAINTGSSAKLNDRIGISMLYLLIIPTMVPSALAAFTPTVLIAYALFGLFLGTAELFAHPAVLSAIFERSHVLVQLLFTPLLAGWSIWMGIAISARSSDVRAAQQLAVFASLPPLGVVALLSFDVIPASAALALGLAAALLLLDGFGWRAVAAIFDRERLITGSRG